MAWRRFFLWALPGSVVGFGFVAAASIGLAFIPVGLGLWLVAARRHERAGVHGEQAGLFAGFGMVALGIGLLHVPETKCLSDGQPPPGSHGCEDFATAPWIGAGALVILAALTVFAVIKFRGSNQVSDAI